MLTRFASRMVSRAATSRSFALVCWGMRMVMGSDMLDVLVDLDVVIMGYTASLLPVYSSVTLAMVGNPNTRKRWR